MSDTIAINEQLVLDAEDRHASLLDGLRSAKRSIRMSMFRCDDVRIIQALAQARRRSVDVRVIITNRAKGSMAQLAGLHRQLKDMDVEAVRYTGPFERYHAKYAIVDDTLGLVSTMNLTREHFRDTHDLLFVTVDPALVF